MAFQQYYFLKEKLRYSIEINFIIKYISLKILNKRTCNAIQTIRKLLRWLYLQTVLRVFFSTNFIYKMLFA